MNIKKLTKITFKQGNTCVVGLRGRGKDMLIANVIARRKMAYISNVDYHCQYSEYMPLDLSKLDTGNDYTNFLSQKVKKYIYPYPEGLDIYISDTGIYFPSQYNGELNKQCKSLPVFMALSRQLGQCNVHTNCQNLNRVWDKIREQSDLYIMCNSCKVLFKKIVVQRITIYDKADSCQNRVKPFKPLRIPLTNRGGQRPVIRAKNDELKRSFDERNGKVKSYLLIYVNKSKYDTRIFKSMLEV